MADKTIFEKIIDREVPADIWYEDELVIVFFDINPVSFGHSLVVSKKPYPWIQDAPPTELGKIFERMPSLINKLKQATGTDFVKLSVVGTDVPHFHIHLIPLNFSDTNHHDAPADPSLKDKDRTELLERLRES